MAVAGSLSLMSPWPLRDHDGSCSFVCSLRSRFYTFVVRWCSGGCHVYCATIAAPLATWIFRSHSA